MEKKKNVQGKKKALLKSLKKNYWLYLFVLPAILWYVIFQYIPMGGIVIAFKRYNGVLSIWDSPWVGLKWFKSFFNSYYSTTIIKNTIVLSLYSLLTFPLPIMLALVFNELKNKKVKQVTQTIMYAPHFISTVVLVSMMRLFFAPGSGFVNTVIEALGGTSFDFMSSAAAFTHMYVWSGVWQGLGWDCIIYVAALAGVDPSLHESAQIDGATRLQRIRYINIPCILPTIVITLIMRVGHIMSVGADKVLVIKNDLNADTAQIISTYVYERGLLSGDYSYAAAVGLFVNVINFVMLVTVNKISKKLMVNGIPISLEIEKIYHKVVEQQRGGCCFELNCMFAWLLRELDFEVKSYPARYLRNETGVPVRRHQILLVTCEDGKYICDVGVGQSAPRYPLAFVEDLVQTQLGEQYKFERNPELGWVLHDYHKGEWKRFYAFTEEKQYDIDFVQPLFYCEKHPNSVFNKVTMVALKTKEGRKTLHDRTYKEFADGELVYLEENVGKERLTDILRLKFNLRNFGESNREV